MSALTSPQTPSRRRLAQDTRVCCDFASARAAGSCAAKNHRQCDDAGPHADVRGIGRCGHAILHARSGRQAAARLRTVGRTPMGGGRFGRNSGCGIVLPHRAGVVSRRGPTPDKSRPALAGSAHSMPGAMSRRDAIPFFLRTTLFGFVMSVAPRSALADQIVLQGCGTMGCSPCAR